MSETEARSAPGIGARVRGILFNPKQEWSRIAAEETPSRAIFTGYVMPLAAIGPIAGTIGGQVFGRVNLMMGPYMMQMHPPLISAIVGAIVTWVLTLVCFLALTVIADVLSPRFGGPTGSDRTFALVGYGITPVLVAGIFALFPPVAFLTVLGLYSLYLIWVGTPVMLRIAADKATPYTVALVICGMILNAIVFALSAANMALLNGMGLLG